MNQIFESRQDHLDLIAGILILFMVFHHSGTLEELHQLLSRILFFFMPWFFFKGGMFHSSNKTIVQVLYSSCKRLLIPFTIFCILGQMIEGLNLLLHHNLHKNFFYEPFVDLLRQGSLWTNGPLWFLWSLFCVRIIYHILINNNCGRLIVVLFSLLFSFLLFYFRIKTPLYLGNVCLGLFFYSFGHLLQNKQYLNMVGVPCILLYLAIVLFFPAGGSFVENDSNNYMCWIFASLIAIVAYNYSFRFIKIDNGLFHYCGRHSLSILVVHFPILRIIEWIFY